MWALVAHKRRHFFDYCQGGNGKEFPDDSVVKRRLQTGTHFQTIPVVRRKFVLLSLTVRPQRAYQISLPLPYELC